jgi:GT2 family glycosyltransferase
MISVIIVTYNNCAATLACLESLFAHHQHSDFEALLVDNASSDDTVRAVRLSYPSVTVLAQRENLGFGAANNIGAAAAKGDVLFFLNNDTLMTSPVMDELAAVLHRDDSASAVAPRLTDPDGTFQLSVGFIPSIVGESRTKRLQRECHENDAGALAVARRREPEWASAAALMVRAEAFSKIGGFDERFFMYFEDVDLCLRLRAEAGPLLYEASVAIIHLGGASWKNEDTHADRIRTTYRHSQLLFYAKHHGLQQNLLVRAFLILKYGPSAFVGRDADAKALLKTVVIPPRTLLKQAHRRGSAVH